MGNCSDVVFMEKLGPFTCEILIITYSFFYFMGTLLNTTFVSVMLAAGLFGGLREIQKRAEYV